MRSRSACTRSGHRAAINASCVSGASFRAKSGQVECMGSNAGALPCHSHVSGDTEKTQRHTGHEQTHSDQVLIGQSWILTCTPHEKVGWLGAQAGRRAIVPDSPIFPST